jgi:hypothetical protein
MDLIVHVHSATVAECEAGIAAANAVFAAAGCTPLEAAQGFFDRDCWDDCGFPDPAPSPETFMHADAWMSAEEAALEACCRGWPAIPSGSYLELVMEKPKWLEDVIVSQRPH